MKNGQIIILNGAPRSGKSSIVTAIQETFDGIWMNLGVDAYVKQITPAALLPGIGLRPGGERKDLEGFIYTCYAVLYESIAAHSRAGLNVVVDVGHHDYYHKPLHILENCARILSGLPVIFVGVRCSIACIMERRNSVGDDERSKYVAGTAEDPVPRPVQLWQDNVHVPGIYDLEVDTSIESAKMCAEKIKTYLNSRWSEPTAFQKLSVQ